MDLLGNEFMHWLRAAKEMVNKLSEPTGDRESLSSKVTQVTKLITEKTQGQQKLEEALSKAEAACKASDEEDREIVEEEAAFLQEGDVNGWLSMKSSLCISFLSHR